MRRAGACRLGCKVCHPGATRAGPKGYVFAGRVPGVRPHLLVAFPFAFAGCLAAVPLVGEPGCDAPLLDTLLGPSERLGLARAPGEPTPILYWGRNPMASNATLVATTLPTPVEALDPANPSRAAEPSGLAHAVAPGGLAFGAMAADASNPAGLVFQAELAGEACGESGLGVVSAPLAPERERPVGEVGKGVLVRTGGFWTNGTSFYTNHAGVHETPGIPKGYLGDYAGAEPLKVYVYAEGEERPPLRYQQAGFLVTIPGFNAALVGLPEGVARVALLAPEDAYTREGREGHPLHGDAILFWIEVDEVVDIPCTLPAPPCDLPGLPPPPVPPPAGAPFA